MDQLLLSLLLLLCLGPGITVSQTISSSKTLVGALGKSVILLLNLPEKLELESIVWLHNGSSSIAISNPEEKSGSKVSVLDPEWKDRLEVIQPYSLKLRNLTWKDTGYYRAQINTKDSKLFYKYTLLIFEQLRDLQVTHDVQRTENRICKVHLTCSISDPSDNITLEWNVPRNASEVNLTIFWDPMNSSDENYTCTASNPVSNVSSSVSLRVLCTEPPTFQTFAWIITPICISISISIILFVFLVRHHHRKKKRNFHISTQHIQSSEVTMNNTEYFPVSPGATVYAQVTNSKRATETPPPMKKEDSSTIYATVQHSSESKPISPKTTALNSVI